MQLGDSKPVVSFAVDYISDEALGASKTTHVLQQFNASIVTCHPGVDEPQTSVDVWRIDIVSKSGGPGTDDVYMKLGDHLSSFIEQFVGLEVVVSTGRRSHTVFGQ